MGSFSTFSTGSPAPLYVTDEWCSVRSSRLCGGQSQQLLALRRTALEPDDVCLATWS